MTLDAIETEAMNLNTEDRTHLLDRLVSSLDVDAEILAAWDLEAERRDADVEAGKVALIPAKEAFAKLYKKFQ